MDLICRTSSPQLSFLEGRYLGTLSHQPPNPGSCQCRAGHLAWAPGCKPWKAHGLSISRWQARGVEGGCRYKGGPTRGSPSGVPAKQGWGGGREALGAAVGGGSRHSDQGVQRWEEVTAISPTQMQAVPFCFMDSDFETSFSVFHYSLTSPPPRMLWAALPPGAWECPPPSSLPSLRAWPDSALGLP